MDEFMDEFMNAMKEVFPNLLVQFEDFSTDNAFKYLSRFRQKYRCFNDDVSRHSYDRRLYKQERFRSRAQVQSYYRAS
jgi:Malic enzyme, N-terminal domain